MSTTVLTNILSDDQRRARLIAIANDYAELNIEVEYQKQLFQQSMSGISLKIENIKNEAACMGLKPAEFKRISQLLSESELLYNEAAFLEQLIGLLQ